MNRKVLTLTAYAILVVAATAIPVGSRGIALPHEDKLVHGVMFALLGMISSWTAPKKHVMVITGGLMLAVLTELMQVALPWRSFEMLDLLADAIGVVVGWAVYTHLAKLR